MNTAHNIHAGQFSQVKTELGKGLLRHDSGLVKLYDSRHCFPFTAVLALRDWLGRSIDIMQACMKRLIVHERQVISQAYSSSAPSVLYCAYAESGKEVGSDENIAD